MSYSFTFDSATVFVATSIMTFLTVLIALWFRSHLKTLRTKIKNKTRPAIFRLSERTKYKEVNTFSLSRPFILWGLVVGTTVSLFAINWTIFKAGQETNYEIGAFDKEELIVIPRTSITEPKIVQPPKFINPIPDPVIEESPEFIDLELTEEVLDAPIAVEEKTIPAPPPPPPVHSEYIEIFTFAEQMPRFPGCEHLEGGKAEKEKCAVSKLMEFIYKHVKYPAIARETGIEGTAVVQFVVGRAGEIEDIKIARDPGAGLGDAAKEVIEKMAQMKEKWTPGMQGAKSVKVQYNVPIRFKLQN